MEKTDNGSKQTVELYDEGLSWYQKIVGFFTVSAWIFLFACGLLINSEPYRNVVTGQYSQPATIDLAVEGTQAPSLLESWIVVIFCYTPTNLMFLCILMGLIGALSRIAKLHTTTEGQRNIPSDKTNPLISGIFRGLFVYLLVISGILLINEAPIITPTQIQYARLAGIMSIFSFQLSYNPSQFRSFLKTGIKKMEGSVSDKNDED